MPIKGMIQLMNAAGSPKVKRICEVSSLIYAPTCWETDFGVMLGSCTTMSCIQDQSKLVVDSGFYKAAAATETVSPVIICIYESPLKSRSDSETSQKVAVLMAGQRQLHRATCCLHLLGSSISSLIGGIKSARWQWVQKDRECRPPRHCMWLERTGLRLFDAAGEFTSSAAAVHVFCSKLDQADV